MRTAQLALAIALALVAPALAALSDVEFRFHKPGTITPGENQTFSDLWEPAGAPLTPDQQAALTMVQEVIRTDPFVMGQIESAVERMKHIKAGGPLSVQGGASMQVAPSGKIIIVLNTHEPYASGNAFATLDRPAGGGRLDPMIHLSVGNIIQEGRLNLGERDNIKRVIADTMVHEADHIDTFMAEFIADREVWKRGSLSSSSEGAHHPWTLSNPQNAFLEGKAEASQLFAYENESDLLRSSSPDRPPFYKDGLCTPRLFGMLRSEIPYNRPDLVYILEQDARDPATFHREVAAVKRGPEKLDAKTWQGLWAMQEGEALTMKTFGGMMATEGVVALTLRDMYMAGLAHPKDVTDAVQKGVKSLPDLVKHLKEVTYKGPEFARQRAHVDLILNRRTLGTYLSPTLAPAWFRQRMEGKPPLTAEDAQKNMDAEFVRRHPDVGPELVAKNPAVVKLNVLAFDPDEKPGGRPSPGASGAAPLPAAAPSKQRPAHRIKARELGAGTKLMMKAGGSMGMALSVSMMMTTLTDVMKGKTAPSDLGSIMKMARQQLTDPAFLTMTVAGMGVEEGIESGGEAVMVKLLTSRGSQQMARQACAKMKFGGAIVSVVAGLVSNQLLNHDFSFLKCSNLSAGERTARFFKVILTDFSGWDKKAVLEVALGAAGFALASAIVVASGGSALLVMGAGMVVGFAATYAAGWLAGKIDRLQYGNVKKSIQWVLDEHAKNDPRCELPLGSSTWLHIDASDETYIENAGNVEQKRAALAEVMGRVGEKGVEKFTCTGNVVEKSRGVTSGVFSKFFEKREGFVAEVLAEMNEFTAAHQERLDEATADFVKVSSPVSGGLDLRRLAILFAYDQNLRPLAPETVADLIVAAVRADPKLDGDPGAQPKATDDQIDALHARYLGAVTPFLRADEKTLRSEHYRAARDLRMRNKSAFQRFTSLRERWETEVKTKISEFVKELEAAVTEERTDIASFDLQRIQPQNPKLIEFIQERSANLEGMVRGYQEMYKLQQTAPSTPRDEGVQAYLDDLEDWEPERFRR